MPRRRFEVPAARLERWIAGFFDRHGAGTLRPDGATVTLDAPDGARAVLEVWSPVVVGAAGEVTAREVTRWARGPEVLGLVLVRRGGYAVGLARADELIGHKVGTRYVQSRTAAGGWSQQRFARRRGNQADELAGAVADHAVRLLDGPGGLVVGGDRRLVAQVLADPRLERLGRLPRRELFDLPDPRLAVLRDALARGRSARVVLTEPP